MSAGGRFARWFRIVPALGVGTAGGLVFFLLGIPLAWLLGALAACMAVSLLGHPMASPRNLRPPMAVVLGLAIGAGFQPGLAGHYLPWLLSLALVVPFALGITAAGAVYFNKVAGYDRLTAIYCSVPGGLTEIVLLAEKTPADIRTISLVHAARIALTIAILSIAFSFFVDIEPSDQVAGTMFAIANGTLSELLILLVAGFLGWRVGVLLRLPAPHMFGPLILSAILHGTGVMSVQLPGIMVAIAQIVIGAGIGCRFVGSTPVGLLRIFGHGFVFVTVVLSLGVSMGIMLQTWTNQDLATVVLAFAPGGLTELSLLALAAGLDASFVAAHHLVRQLSVIVTSPAISAWFSRFDRR